MRVGSNFLADICFAKVPSRSTATVAALNGRVFCLELGVERIRVPIDSFMVDRYR